MRKFFQTISYRGWFVIGSGFLVILTIVLTIRSCGAVQREVERVRAAEATAEGKARSGKAAVDIVSSSAEAAATSEAFSRDTREAIEAAKGADDEISPELDAAIRSRICLRDAYRCKSPCVEMLGACSK